MTEQTNLNEWATAEHARAYLERADGIVNRQHGEAMVQDLVPLDAGRILDLGTGDGRLLALLKRDRPHAAGIGLDFSAVMLDAARRRFADDETVRIIEHNLGRPLPLPDLGRFDAVISSFAIHHLPDERKRALYEEVFHLLNPGGVFCNLEHVAPPSLAIHLRWVAAMGRKPEDDDPSNLLAPVETQLDWLRQIGFIDADCYWKWYELAVLAGWRPA
jgi:SAM-dependent methyltransferase